MRILILSQNYYPEPDQKMHILAKELVKIGHEVRVITSFPNYPEGKIYPGYKQRLVQKEKIDGISLVRLPLYPDKSQSIIRRSLNYLSFPFIATLLGPLVCGRADVMLVYHPPITLGIPALVISIIRRLPFVYEIQDMWPETLLATGMISNQMILGLIGIFCKFVYRWASAITVISPGFKQNLICKGVEGEKISVLYNWAYEGDFILPERNNDFARMIGLDGFFNVMYAGNLGPAQGLENILDTAALLQDINDLQFVFIGGGIDHARIINEVRVRKINNIKFLPRVPIDSMPAYYALADVLMIHLKNDPLFEITIPGKTQSYLLSGKPIIASVNGDTAKLIEEAGAGYGVKAMDPRDLANVTRKIYNMSLNERRLMGDRGREFYYKRLSPEVQVMRYESIFREITNVHD